MPATQIEFQYLSMASNYLDLHRKIKTIGKKAINSDPAGA